MKNKILFITSSRSDFASLRKLIDLTRKNRSLSPVLFVTGDHTRKETGNTYMEIMRHRKIDFLHKNKGITQSARFADVCVALDTCIKIHRPTLVVVCGDRRESLAAATASLLNTVPIVHVHGGDLTQGMVDDAVRHAITKMAAIHCTATPGAAQHVRQMGEERWRVHMTGSSDIDALNEKIPEQETLREVGVSSKKYALVILNPESLSRVHNKQIARAMLNALESYGDDIVVIHPNNDPGAHGIREVYTTLKNPRFKTFVSLPRPKYASLLKNAAFLIGNSSSGITEAATFKTPVINIGKRQDGRERGKNVINSPATREALVRALHKVQHPSFLRSLKNLKNVYGNGDASKKILKVLENTVTYKKVDELLYKRFV